MRNTKILAGSSHPELAELVTKRLGMPLSETTLKKFSNKETNVEIRKSEFFKPRKSTSVLTLLSS
jgi:ribose-phosphate pyrophosphokinase